MIGVLTLLALLGVGAAGAAEYVGEYGGPECQTGNEDYMCTYDPRTNKTTVRAIDVGRSYLRIDKASFDAMLKDYPEAKLRVILVKDPCLAKMEAALKAVEPWLGYTYKYDTNPSDFKRAKAFYYEVRRDCSKEKP